RTKQRQRLLVGRSVRKLLGEYLLIRRLGREGNELIRIRCVRRGLRYGPAVDVVEILVPRDAQAPMLGLVAAYPERVRGRHHESPVAEEQLRIGRAGPPDHMVLDLSKLAECPIRTRLGREYLVDTFSRHAIGEQSNLERVLRTAA